MLLTLSAKGHKPTKLTVTSIESAATEFVAWRDLHYLGASELTGRCGRVCTEDGKMVAFVHYNGKVVRY